MDVFAEFKTHKTSHMLWHKESETLVQNIIFYWQVDKDSCYRSTKIHSTRQTLKEEGKHEIHHEVLAFTGRSTAIISGKKNPSKPRHSGEFPEPPFWVMWQCYNFFDSYLVNVHHDYLRYWHLLRLVHQPIMDIKKGLANFIEANHWLYYLVIRFLAASCA